MIIVALSWAVVLALAAYARKNWYTSLCGLILLMGVHDLMPRSLFGIRGLSAWNLLFVAVLLAWANSRRRERLVWDMPRGVTVLLASYLCAVLVSTFRMFADRAAVDETTAALISNQLINMLKWPLLGLLIFHGCRDRNRSILAASCLCLSYLLLAVQALYWMPLSSSGDELTNAGVFENFVGYHRVDLSMLLGGASWATLALLSNAKSGGTKLLIVGAAVTIVLGQAVTGGRTGYVTWVVVGLVLCLTRWRKTLLFLPIAAAMAIAIVPGASERMTQGFSVDRLDTTERVHRTRDARRVFGFFESTTTVIDTQNQGQDYVRITSGRSFVWPFVLDQIRESPILGHGRLAMARTGLTQRLEAYGLRFGHPHNAYLQLWLDTGAVGLLMVLPFYVLICWWSLSLFRDSRSPVFVSIGGMTLALVLALLVGAIGSHSFYPQFGSVGMWCAIGLMLRVHVERSRAGALAATSLTTKLGADRWHLSSQPGRHQPSAFRHEAGVRRVTRRHRPESTVGHVDEQSSERLDELLWQRRLTSDVASVP